MFSAARILSTRAAWAISAMVVASASGQSLSILPGDVDVAIRLRGAASMRATPAGQAVVGILTDLGAFDRAENAWTTLAASLELEPAPAFDALLGDDAMLAIRWPAMPDAADPEWILVSQISAETEAIIARRHRLAPRGLVARRHVLALEDGRFELAIDPRPTRDGEPSCSRIVFAPAHASVLLEETLANLVGTPSPVPTLAGEDGGRQLDANDRDGASVFVRSRPGMPGWLRWPGRDGRLVASGVVDGASATIEWSFSPPSIDADATRGLDANPESNSAPSSMLVERLGGGVVRPEAWARASIDRPLEQTPLRFAARIQDVRWDVVLDPSGVERGTAVLRFNPGRASASVP